MFKKMHHLTLYGKKLLRSCNGIITPFLLHLFYFISLSLVGFGVLKSLKPRTISPNNLDMFFTSVSAATVSSMSTVEMEVFSNSQLVVMTFLMFVGGEVFTSMVGLHFKKSKVIDTLDQIELSIVSVTESGPGSRFHTPNDVFSIYKPFIKHESIKFLGFVVLGYLIAIHILGVGSVLVYFAVVSSAKDVLRNKGIKTFTFAVFTTVSTFSSCGFVPTNENMIVFRKNSGLLWILVPLVLMGNTLFPSSLRFSIWVLGKRYKKSEANYLLKHSREVGYLHLLPGLHSLLVVVTVFGFILIGLVLFSVMEWESAALSGLSVYQKLVGALFQIVNARHTGETIVDLSTIAQAVLVFFIVMMYLPPYTSFLPFKSGKDNAVNCEERRKQRRIGDNLVFSQLTYLAIFVIFICITERKSLIEDPINFSVLNIVLEVISAYGNVGFTTGYGCVRRLEAEPSCVDKWYGFAGKWSDQGKIVLISVMIFGRLKKFNMSGGQAWKLL